MKEKIENLPNWIITDLKPGFYDTESKTVIQQTSNLYKKMQEIIDFCNEQITNQNMTIEEAIEYMKLNLVDTIKELNEDGELNSLIVKAISDVENKLLSLQRDYENEINSKQINYENELENKQNDFENEIENKQNDFENEINSKQINFEGEIENKQIDFQNNITQQIKGLANGSPLVASSTSGMTDISKTYVNTSDGKWYYHNGSTWVAGGTYQNSVLSSESVDIKHLKYELKEAISIKIPELELNSGYRTNYGSIVSHNSYYYSSPYKLKKGETVFLKGAGYQQNVGMIVLVTKDGSTIRCVQTSIDSNVNLYKFTTKEDCYISLTYDITKESYCYITRLYETTIDVAKKEALNEVVGIDLKLENLINGKYIYIGGNEVNYSNNYYSVTDFIEVPSNTELVMKDFNWASTDDAHYAFYDESKNLIKAIKLSPCGDLEFKTPANAKYFRCTINNENKCKYGLYLFIKTDLTKISEQNNKETTKNLFAGFIKFGVIGDSLASGECAYKDSNGNVKYVDIYENSWGQFIARKQGMECVNFSKGGLSTRTWLTDSRGLEKLQESSNKCKTYIIGLGVNDYYHLGESYLGTVNDINLDNPLNSLDTFYGNYAKIIYHVKQVQPKTKIFMLTIPNYNNNELKRKFNEAIREISSLFENVYLIDLDYDYNNEFAEFIASNERNGHYNAIAYQYIGDLLFNAISDYMYKNSGEFEQIEFIETEYSY